MIFELSDALVDAEKRNIMLRSPGSDNSITPSGGTLRPDIIAGLTAAAVVLPKAMAYATVAGLSVALGLYTAFVPIDRLCAAGYFARIERKFYDNTCNPDSGGTGDCRARRRSR